MRVFKVGNKWSYDFYVNDINGNKIRVRKSGFDKKRDANEQGIKAYNELQFNKKGSDIKLKELVNDYLSFKKNKIIETTYIKLENQINQHIIPALGNVKINDLTIKHIQHLQSELIKKELSINYINKLVTNLSSVLKFGTQNYGLTKNVANISGSLKDTSVKKELTFFTYDEWKMFASVIDNEIYLALFSVLYFCGLRKGECLALTWKDLDDKGNIKITKSMCQRLKGVEYKILPTKNKGSNRTVLAPKIVFDKLLELKAYYTRFGGFTENWLIFGGVTPIKNTTLTNAKNKYCKLAGVKQIKLHDFRHSHASLLINNGVNVLVVSKRLGHVNVNMTLNTYSHMFKEKENEAVSFLNKLS